MLRLWVGPPEPHSQPLPVFLAAHLPLVRLNLLEVSNLCLVGTRGQASEDEVREEPHCPCLLCVDIASHAVEEAGGAIEGLAKDDGATGHQ